MSKYLVVDLETTMRSPISSESHFAWPDNRIVMGGLLKDDGTVYTTDNLLKGGLNTTYIHGLWNYIKEGAVIVGHNIKFDILYLLKQGWLMPKDFANVKIFDTQLCEYLLSAQQSTYPSLDDCATKYGGKVKDDAVRTFWEAGTPTEDIPEKILTEYLIGDLKNTEIVYKSQMELVKKRKMERLVAAQMLALRAVILMEYNGLKVDTGYIEKNIDTLQRTVDNESVLLRSSVAEFLPEDYGDWQWSSPRDVSNLFFGGEYKIVEKQLVGKYKNGKDKYKNTTVVKKMEGMNFDPTKRGSSKTKLGWFVTDDAVLKNIDNEESNRILTLRQLSKWKETYYQNMKDLTFLTGFVHPNLNMVSTKTGRLSCNKPNIQNQTTEGGIKNAYVSRFGDGGSLVEFDYSQLEMAGLAYVSGDRQLTEDINNGVDMHNELYKAMYGRYPTKEERKPFKRLSFGLVYGAGPTKLSEQAGCSVDDAKKFIKVFYNRYTGVAEFHKSIMEESDKKKQLIAEHTPKGFPRHAYLKRLPTGRMFVFKDYDNEWKGGVSFSPTELKNWPVQGFSTGDVVPFMVGVVTTALYKTDRFTDRVFPVMTVHDSILFDIVDTSLVDAVEFIKSVLSNTTDIFNKWFGTNLEVQLSTGCSIGKNWGNLKEI